MKHFSALVLPLILLLAIAASSGAADTAPSAAPAKPKPLITVSKETTVLIEPLRSDGQVDYIAAINKRTSEGVTPENNSAVLFWQAVGPGPIAPTLGERYFKMLGMAPPPVSGNYFQELNDFARHSLSDKSNLPSAGTSEKPGEDERLEKQLDKACGHAWVKADDLLLYRWLEANQKPLELVAQASMRPRRFDPLIPPDDSNCLFYVELPIVHMSRALADAFAARALLRLGGGDVDKACDDLMTIHRLARQVGAGDRPVLEGLVGQSIDMIAYRVSVAVLRTGRLSSAQLQRMRTQLARLGKAANLADDIDHWERLSVCDAVADISRHGFEPVIALVGGPPVKEESTLERWRKQTALAVVDWDSVLRSSNSWFDRIVAVLKKPGVERRLAVRELKHELKVFTAEQKPADILANASKDGKRAMSDLAAKATIGLLAPGFDFAASHSDKSEMALETERLGFAIAAFDADNGRLPVKLEELTPKYADTIPVDCFSDEPLIYRPSGRGYLLYSVGFNVRDDGGPPDDVNLNIFSESNDDIGLRIGDAESAKK